MKKAMKKKMTAKQKKEWFEAVKNNDIETVKKMLKEGIDVKTVDTNGWTALHDACYWEYIDIAKLLIDNRADINIHDNDGWTPLHIVCYGGRTEMAKLLIDNGADVILKDKNGNTPLDRLKFYQQHHEELIQWLSENHPEKALEAMASENIQGKGVGL